MSGRALIVKLGAIGDVAMAVPAARKLYEKGLQVDWVCGRAALPLLECFSWIRTIPADDTAMLRGSALQRGTAITALWRSLVGPRYDLCATLYRDARYKVLSLPVRATKRVSLSQVARERMLIPGRHHTDEYARILLQAMEWSKDVDTPESLSPVRPDRMPKGEVVAATGQLRVVLVPGGARNLMRDDALRRWPIENYVQVAKRLIQLGVEVLLVGGPEDSWVNPSFDGLSVRNLVGALSLAQSMALFDTVDIVVTHDTGPLHLAGLTRAAVVGIFGPTDPREKIPRRDYSVALWGGEGFACRPCYDGRNYAPCLHNGCMHQVTPAMVMAEVDELLNKRRLGIPAPVRIVVPECAPIASTDANRLVMPMVD